VRSEEAVEDMEGFPGTSLPHTGHPGMDIPGMNLPGMHLPGMHLPSYCVSDSSSAYSEGELQVVEGYKYICDGVLVSIIGLIGVLGNLCAVLVLARPKLRDCFHQLLIALAFFDTLYIICGGINYTFRAFEEDVPFESKSAYKVTYPHLILPFLNVGLCGTIFMTVAISIERFLGICHPLHYPPHTRKSWFYIVPVSLVSVLVNLPKFLEAEIYWENDINAIEILRGENVTVSDIPRYIPNYRPTELRMDETYIEIYLMYFRIFFIAAIPLLLIVLLNLRILYDIGTSKVHRFGSSRRRRREVNLFIILLCIVVTFICCHTPRIIADIWEFSYNHDRMICSTIKKIHPRVTFISPFWILCLSHVSHAMGILNSSINFIIYSFVGHTFRSEFLLLLRCGRRSQPWATQSSYMSTVQTSQAPGAEARPRPGAEARPATDLEEKQIMLEIT